MNEKNEPHIDRRSLFSGLGALGVAAALPARANAKAVGRRVDASALSGLALREDFESLFGGGCQVTAGDVEGPYHFDTGLYRKDVTEGLPGLNMTCVFELVRASDCSPIENAVVDLWHSDADTGRYSGYAALGTAGETWMRGLQVTDASGRACFDTIYPGWYTGRTTHIHIKVYPTPNSEFTTQFYFPSRASMVIYTFPPYDSHGPQDTTNAQDFGYSRDREMRLVRQGGQLYSGIRIVVN